MTTREKIVTKALELFNARGIEYVGMRELAASIDLKLGNITYYFPTKEDLIHQLALDLSALNAGVWEEREQLSIPSFLDMIRQHFNNQVRYRCLLLSFVHLMGQYPKIAGRYGSVDQRRKITIEANLKKLMDRHYLKGLSATEIDFLVGQISLIARFWISEAAISYRQLSAAQQIEHYLTQIAHLLLPYSTPEGSQAIHRYLTDKDLSPA